MGWECGVCCVLCVRGCGGVWSGVWMWPISVWCALNLCTVSWVGQSQMLKFENGQKTTISQRFTPSLLTPHTHTHTSNKSGQCELLTESATAFVVALLLLLSCCRCYSVYGQRPMQFHSIQLVCVCLSCEAQKYAAYFQAAVEKVRMRFMPGNKKTARSDVKKAKLLPFARTCLSSWFAFQSIVGVSHTPLAPPHTHTPIHTCLATTYYFD